MADVGVVCGDAKPSHISWANYGLPPSKLPHLAWLESRTLFITREVLAYSDDEHILFMPDRGGEMVNCHMGAIVGPVTWNHDGLLLVPFRSTKVEIAVSESVDATIGTLVFLQSVAVDLPIRLPNDHRLMKDDVTDFDDRVRHDAFRKSSSPEYSSTSSQQRPSTVAVYKCSPETARVFIYHDGTHVAYNHSSFAYFRLKNCRFYVVIAFNRLNQDVYLSANVPTLKRKVDIGAGIVYDRLRFNRIKFTWQSGEYVIANDTYTLRRAYLVSSLPKYLFDTMIAYDGYPLSDTLETEKGGGKPIASSTPTKCIN
jgi:hypothetical protein